MPKTAVLGMAGREVGQIELSEAAFGIEPNVAVMYELVKNYLANQRQGTQSTLTRSKVTGGGRKSWRREGTGHARQGSIRAPQRRHGGVVSAPKSRDYRYTVSKKVRRLITKFASSNEIIDNEIVVLDQIVMDEYKIEVIASMLQALGAKKKALIALPEENRKVIASVVNLQGVKTATINTLNVYDILNADKFIVFKDAVARIEEVYA